MNAQASVNIGADKTTMVLFVEDGWFVWEDEAGNRYQTECLRSSTLRGEKEVRLVRNGEVIASAVMKRDDRNDYNVFSGFSQSLEPLRKKP
jgi:hypothetical protein